MLPRSTQRAPARSLALAVRNSSLAPRLGGPSRTIPVDSAPPPRAAKAGIFGLSAGPRPELATLGLHERVVVTLVEGQVVDALTVAARDVALDARVVLQLELLLDG